MRATRSTFARTWRCDTAPASSARRQSRARRMRRSHSGRTGRRRVGTGCPGLDLAVLGDEHSADRIADEAGLLVPLHLEREARDDLEPAAAELVDLRHFRARAHIAAGRHGRGETHLVPAVVDAEHEARRRDQLHAEAIDQAEREVAVRDRRSERALGLGALDVDMDPLIVAGEIGERVDHLLGHLTPVGRADGPTLKLPKALDSVCSRDSHGERGYSMSLIPRKLPTIAPAPPIRPSTRVT